MLAEFKQKKPQFEGFFYWGCCDKVSEDRLIKFMKLKDLPKKKILLSIKPKLEQLSFAGDYSKETIWATQAQITDVFQVERSVVTKHIRNILRDKELNSDSVCANFAHTADDKNFVCSPIFKISLILCCDLTFYRRSGILTIWSN